MTTKKSFSGAILLLLIASFLCDKLKKLKTLMLLGSSLIMDIDAQGRPTASYSYGLGLTGITAGRFKGFYHTDMLGSITEITGKEGNPLRSYRYDAWGEMTSGETAHDVNPFRYVGAYGVRWQDSTLGMYHMGARWYGPQVGRFTQRDLLMSDPRQPQALNRYIYASNNPLLKIDPSGLINTVPHPTEYVTLTMHTAIQTLLGRLRVQPNCMAAFKRLKCGDIAQILGNKNGPPTISVAALPSGKPGGYIEGTNQIILNENYVYPDNYYYVAHTLCHELAHWCRAMRLGVNNPSGVETPEGDCVERDCFGSN